MLSIEQLNTIENELSKDSASEFVLTILNRYASTVDRTSELLEHIPKLAEKQLQMKQTRLNQYSAGLDLLIADRHIHPSKYKKSEENMRFCTLYYVCKAHFSEGNAEKDSISGKAFFNEFVQLLRERKAFDYLDNEEWDWVYSIAGGGDWLESVIKQHIDSQFTKPAKSRRGCCKHGHF